MKSQKEAVYDAVVQVLANSGLSISADNGVNLTPEQRRAVIDIVSNGISDKTVQFSDSAVFKHNTPQKIHTYAGSLVSNWLRKDPRLSSTTDSAPKSTLATDRPDSYLKNLKNLLWNLQNVYGYVPPEEEDEAVEDVLAEIRFYNKRELLSSSRADMSTIPDSLKHLLNVR